MKADPSFNETSGYLVMFASILVGVSVITAIDVQVSLSQIDPSDSRTWPNMAPQIRYLFIPVMAAFVAMGSVVVDAVLEIVQRRRLVRLIHWALLGGGYSLVLLVLPIIRVGVNGTAALIVSVIAAFSVVLLIRWRYGVSQ